VVFPNPEAWQQSGGFSATRSCDDTCSSSPPTRHSEHSESGLEIPPPDVALTPDLDGYSERQRHVRIPAQTPVVCALASEAPRLPLQEICGPALHRPLAFPTSQLRTTKISVGLVGYLLRHAAPQPSGLGVSLHFADFKCQDKKVQTGHRAGHVEQYLEPCGSKFGFRTVSTGAAGRAVNDRACQPAATQKKEVEVARQATSGGESSLRHDCRRPTGKEFPITHSLLGGYGARG